jgi:hypothetical protein
VPTAEAVVPVVVAAPEGEDLGKKYNQRMKSTEKRRGRGEKAGKTKISKHPCRDV